MPRSADVAVTSAACMPPRARTRRGGTRAEACDGAALTAVVWPPAEHLPADASSSEAVPAGFELLQQTLLKRFPLAKFTITGQGARRPHTYFLVHCSTSALPRSSPPTCIGVAASMVQQVRKRNCQHDSDDTVLECKRLLAIN